MMSQPQRAPIIPEIQSGVEQRIFELSFRTLVDVISSEQCRSSFGKHTGFRF
jgi:hypothetical protein